MLGSASASGICIWLHLKTAISKLSPDCSQRHSKIYRQWPDNRKLCFLPQRTCAVYAPSDVCRSCCMPTFPPRQWRAMKLTWSCYRQRNITPQVGTGVAVWGAPTVSRWDRTLESGRLVAQGSNGKQRHWRCSKPNSSGWSACSPLLRHQGSSVARPAACSKSFAEFSQEHFSSDADTAVSRLGPVCCLTA